jgi:serine/threonine-protein kinase
VCSSDLEEWLRDIALKVLPLQNPINNKEKKEYEEAKERFNAEVRAVSLLESDNIVRLYDSGFSNNMQYLAMQYIDGQSLYDIIQRYKKTMPIDKILQYTKQICKGLHFAHSKGVIHRDVKPQNILVSREGDKCHISDFGIARIKREQRLTIVGMAVGTPEYMSPEQASGKNLDHQTDIYSLGILIYEMCTGNPPFYGSDPVSVAYLQVHEEPKKPSRIRHDIPVRLENIIMKALKKDKSERYRSITEIFKDLDALEKEEIGGSSMISKPEDYSYGFLKPVSPAKYLDAGKKWTTNIFTGGNKHNANHNNSKRETNSTEITRSKNSFMIIIILLSVLLGFAVAVIFMLVSQV